MIQGSNAVVVVSRSEPDRIVAFRLGNAGGIVVGYGADEMLVASDLPALIPHTDEVVYLTGGEVASMTRDHVRFSRLDGTVVEKDRAHVTYDALSAVKGPYKHFMLKEINEQAEARLQQLEAGGNVS